MKHRFLTKSTIVFLIFLLTMMNTGCTKEKAEGVKNAAEQFRVEARSALNMTRDLVRQSVLMPVQSKDDEVKQIIHDFNAIPNRSAEQVQAFAEEVLNTGSENEAVDARISSEFKSLEEDYDLFASMFRSLTRGHFFAKDAVAKSERHAVRLTLRFIKMAGTLQKFPVQFTARRTNLIVKLANAQKITDPTARNQELLLSAQEMLQLRSDEKTAKEMAITQCYKAAEAGKLVTELIHNYGKLTIGDILNLTRDSLGMINAATGGTNPDIQGLQTRFEAFVNNKIQQDQLWRDVLQNEIH